MRLNGAISLLISLLCTAGCTKENRALIPPNDTKWVYVEIKVPPKIQVVPLNAFYTSEECKNIKYNSDMKAQKVMGTYVNYIKMVQDKSSGSFKSKIPINGGGNCKWKLGQLTLGIEYSETEHLINSAQVGGAVGAIVVFDGVERKIGVYQSVDNEIFLSPIYYPIIEDDKYLFLFGRESFELYKVRFSGKENVMINFNPVLDESKVVRMIGPKEKKPGSHWRIEYPDGTVTSNGDTAPSFDKLNAM
jgi:hypothetical protein